MGPLVDERTLARLLDDVAAGTTPVADAVEALRILPYETVTDARVDHHRELRTGHPEAIYGPGKTVEQIREIAAALASRANGAVLLTRATPEQAAAAIDAVPGARFHEAARLVVVKAADRSVDATVAVVAAGTSDLPVAEEAAISVEATGARVERITDVGVAGVHRDPRAPSRARGGGLRDRRRRDGGRAPLRRGGTHLHADRRRPDQRGVRRLLRRAVRPADDARVVRARESPS